MAWEEAPRAHLVRVGWITILIGAVGLLRMIPEAVSMSGELDATYSGLLVIDFFLLLTALGVGRALIDLPSWGRHPALFLWGALIATSVVLGNGLAERLSPQLFTASGGRLALLYVPRLALYGVTVLASPYALWGLGIGGEQSRRTLIHRAAWFSSGLLIGAAVSLPLLPQQLR